MKKRRPKPSLDELLKVLPGPDFPSGGIIVDEDLKEAYKTGRGTFRIRARVEFEKLHAPGKELSSQNFLIWLAQKRL